MDDFDFLNAYKGPREGDGNIEEREEDKIESPWLDQKNSIKVSADWYYKIII